MSKISHINPLLASIFLQCVSSRQLQRRKNWTILSNGYWFSSHDWSGDSLQGVTVSNPSHREEEHLDLSFVFCRSDAQSANRHASRLSGEAVGSYRFEEKQRRIKSPHYSAGRRCRVFDAIRQVNLNESLTSSSGAPTELSVYRCNGIHPRRNSLKSRESDFQI